MIVIGGFFLSASFGNYMVFLGSANDIQVEPCDGCEPFYKAIADAAIGSGVLGAILASIGLVFFVYGLKQKELKSSA